MIWIWALILGGLGFLSWLAMTRWVRRNLLSHSGVDIHFATTEDGWHLALRRYLPEKKMFKEPVFLCHGLGSNGYIFDMSRERSLARYLQRQGFEVWILELRGAGLSKTPAWFLRRNQETAFNHFLEKDVPAALGLIQKLSESNKLFWIGHGLGGMMGYAWAASMDNDCVCGLITLCTSVTAHPTSVVGKLKPLLKMVPLMLGTAFRSLARLSAPITAWCGYPFFRFFAVRNGLEKDLMGKWLVNVVENAPGSLLRQVLGWMYTGEYGPSIGEVRTAVMIVAADSDRIAPADTVIPAYRLIAAQDKQLRIFGNDRGDDHDFGHVDLLIGIHAPELIYPELGDWLEKRATRLSG